MQLYQVLSILISAHNCNRPYQSQHEDLNSSAPPAPNCRLPWEPVFSLSTPYNIVTLTWQSVNITLRLDPEFHQNNRSVQCYSGLMLDSAHRTSSLISDSAELFRLFSIMWILKGCVVHSALGSQVRWCCTFV